MLAKVQIWLFSKGSNKEYGTWDRLGNLIQNLRTNLEKIVGKLK